MITNLDRSGWVGASDIYTLISSRRIKKTTQADGSVIETEYPSWAKFKAVKLGLLKPRSVKTKSMKAGDLYEKPILDAYGQDLQYGKTLLVPELALRVNLDGNTNEHIPTIIEVKTYKQVNGGIDRALMKRYYQQVQCQAFAWEQLYNVRPRIEIRSYALNEDDYAAAREGYALPIDYRRLESREVKYDEYFINMKLYPAVKEFADWLNPLMGRAN